ncbi:hypothetical protein HERIO_429 [Hepatospora eriocheir]|uniref:Uncharacterized protein n=1 Tax=Hepatospora eriocheir TaxID=1081669 RepID=A0A1X0QD94_9MICR|nr:hypothetical protein HERIO_429 [Hepatospora eriocheir]
MLEKNDFDRINYLFYDDYFENLSIPDLEFLHFKFPNLDIFIKRLFKINPFISKELFIEYAKRFNITQIDIMNILSYNCNDWIFKVAIRCNIPDLNSYESIKFYLMNKKEFN